MPHPDPTTFRWLTVETVLWDESIDALMGQVGAMFGLLPSGYFSRGQQVEVSIGRSGWVDETTQAAVSGWMATVVAKADCPSAPPGE